MEASSFFINQTLHRNSDNCDSGKLLIILL